MHEINAIEGPAVLLSSLVTKSTRASSALASCFKAVAVNTSRMLACSFFVGKHVAHDHARPMWRFHLGTAPEMPVVRVKTFGRLHLLESFKVLRHKREEGHLSSAGVFARTQNTQLWNGSPAAWGSMCRCVFAPSTDVGTKIAVHVDTATRQVP